MEKIQNLLVEIAGIGPALPGRLTQVYNVCSKKNCICKVPAAPKKHGPYWQLSFTLNGKSSTRAVPADQLEHVRKLTENWQKYKELEKQLAVECLDEYRRSGAGALLTAMTAELQCEQNLAEKDRAIASLEKELAKMQERMDSWKKRAASHADTIARQRARIRDLEKSREDWKEKVQNLKNEVAGNIPAQKKSARKN